MGGGGCTSLAWRCLRVLLRLKLRLRKRSRLRPSTHRAHSCYSGHSGYAVYWRFSVPSHQLGVLTAPNSTQSWTVTVCSAHVDEASSGRRHGGEVRALIVLTYAEYWRYSRYWGYWGYSGTSASCGCARCLAEDVEVFEEDACHVLPRSPGADVAAG